MLNYTVAQALALGRNASKGCPEHKLNLESLGRKVEEFAARAGITDFSDFGIPQIRQLVAEMESRGNKPAYIRHVANAVKLAGNYMTDYHGASPLKLEQRHLPDVQESPKMWLSFDQVATACQVATDCAKHLRTSKHSIPQPCHVGRMAVLMQALCGLRLTEFARLKPDALEGCNLTIGHAGSRTKNETSRRVIPIPQICADELRAFWNTGRTWSTDRTVIGKRIHRVLQLASQATGDAAYLAIDPKDLRKTLANELIEDVSDKWLIAYMGQRFQGVLLRNYASLRPKPEDFPTVRNTAIARLQAHLVDAVEKKIQGLHF